MHYAEQVTRDAEAFKTVYIEKVPAAVSQSKNLNCTLVHRSASSYIVAPPAHSVLLCSVPLPSPSLCVRPICIMQGVTSIAAIKEERRTVSRFGKASKLSHKGIKRIKASRRKSALRPRRRGEMSRRVGLLLTRRGINTSEKIMGRPVRRLRMANGV